MSPQLSTSQGVVTIRPAVSGDAAALRDVRLEALANAPAAFAADYAAAAVQSSDVWLERMADYAQNEAGVICLASAEDRAIGMLGLTREHWPKTRHGGTLWGVYVNPDWRGGHVAEALIQEACDWAHAHSLTLVKLGVKTTNTAAIRCYARCGFTIYGIDPQAIYWDGIYYDEFLMVKHL